MSIADKLTTIAENVPKVYEAGQKSEYDRFWDIYQDNGKRTNYIYGFTGERWTDEIYNPKYPIMAIQAVDCFLYSRITDTKVPISFTRDSNRLFYNCSKLKTIRSLTPMIEDTNWVNMFSGCSALENITFDGVINGTNISFSPCTLLTHDSLINILEHLKDISGTTTTRTLTLGTTNLAKLTDAEKAVATQKGWTLA